MKIPVLFVKAIRYGILAVLASLLMLQTSPFPEGRCEKIELAFIQRVPPFPRGDYRGVAGCLFQALIQQWIQPPSSPPLEKGGQPKVAVLIIDKPIFSHLQAKENGIQQEVQYRKNREAWMRSPESPLALAGLVWLKSGSNRFGTDPQNEIVLPRGTARAGHLRVDRQRVRIIIENPAVAVYLDHQRVTERELKTDADGKTPDLLEIGDLQMKLIQRGEQLGLRLIDLKNPPLLRFSGLNFYKIDLTYRLDGKFIPYRPAKKIKVASITGQVEEMLCPGVVRFMLSGKTHSLEPVFETAQANELFFMFKDSTNGSETYEGGRYLYAELPREDRVMLNFNQAHNPYCAYNSFSTCQIPPMQNWLRVPIRAGEKKYAQSH